MIQRIPVSALKADESFRYDFRNWDYTEEQLRSSLFSPSWIEETADDGETYTLVMDYDGFIEWYNAHIETWRMEDDAPDFTAEEYLPYHIGRTIDIVKEVTP